MPGPKSIGETYSNNFSYGFRYGGGMGLGVNDRIEESTLNLLDNSIGETPVVRLIADSTIGMAGVALARTAGYATMLGSDLVVGLYGVTFGPLLGFEVGTSDLDARANGYKLTNDGRTPPPPPPGSGF